MGQINPNQIKQSYSFIENKGQWDSDVLFLAKSNSLRVWITKKSMVFEQFEVVNANENDRNSKQDKEIKAYAIALEFQKSKNANVEKLREGKTKLNYFIGNDKSKHKTGVMQYEEVMLKGIYEGIDMRYYFDEGEVRYDYIVKPNADPTQIELEIKGAQENNLVNGELVMKTTLKPVVKQGLYAYQNNSAISKRTVNSSFVLNGNKLKLNIGEYDKSKVLVIDPLTMVDSYILTNSGGPEYLYDMTLDDNGDIYFCGEVFDERYPNAGAFNGGTDVIIGKIHSDLSEEYDWMSLFGGDDSDMATAIEVDDDYIYIAGWTMSDESNFPLLNPIFDEFIDISPFNYWNNFLAVFGKTDTYLKFNTYLGSYADENNYPDLKVSSSGNIYLTGSFWNEQSSFYQLNEITTQDHDYATGGERAFIMGLKPNFNQFFHYDLMFSSIFCGDSQSSIHAIDIDEDNYIYITGNTNSSSSSFDISSGAYNSVLPEDSRMTFITKLRYNVMENQNLQILYNSYCGEVKPNGLNQGMGGAKCIMVKNGTIYIGGSVETDGIETTPNAYDDIYSTTQTVYDPFEAFIQVFEPNGNLYNLSYSSYFGGTGSSVITSLDYDDECNSILFAGNTTSEIESSDYFGADIVLPFVADNSIMVGSINTNLTSTNSLTKLAYIYSDADWVTGETIKFNQSENLIYLAGNKRITTEQDMAFYSLFKRPCTIQQGCLCSSLTNTEDWIEFEYLNEPTPPSFEGVLDPTHPFFGAACNIKLKLNIPSPFDICFSHIKISISRESDDEEPNQPIPDTEIISIDQLSNINPFDLYISENATVTIYLYRHEKDNDPCVITKVYQCPCRCELLSNSIITLTPANGAGICDEDDCYIEVGFDLDHNYLNRCFTHFKVKSMVDDEVISETEITEPTPIGQFSPSLLNKCLEPGDDYTVTITMMQGEFDESPCVFENSTFCNVPQQDPTLIKCLDGCPDDFEYYKDEVIEICPSCSLYVTFLAAERCGFQDLQLLSIVSKLNPNGTDNCCYGKTEQEIFELAIEGILEDKDDKRGFKPYKSIDPPHCNSLTRISMSNCWVTYSKFKCLDELEGVIQKDEDELMGNPWTDVANSSSSPGVDFYSDPCEICPFGCKRLVIHKPCANSCCMKQIQVCRNATSPYSIIKPIIGLGPLQSTYDCRDFTYEIEETWIVNCKFSCNYLDGIFGEPYEGKVQEPQNDETDSEILNFLELENSLSIKVYQDAHWLNFQLDNSNFNNYRISVFNIYGSNLDILNISSSDKVNSYKLDISNYSSGTYFFTITNDGILYESGKFIIVK